MAHRLLILVGRHRNLSLALATVAVCLILGMATGLAPLTRLAYLLAGLIAIGYLWARLQLRGLGVSLERLSSRVQVGQWIESRVTLINDIPLPKLALEVEDLSDMPGYRAQVVIDLEGRESYLWELKAYGSRRGLYRVGPVEVVVGDPFGFFSYRRSFGSKAQVLVYPEVVPLSGFSVPPAGLGAQSRRLRLVHEITPNAAGVREYSPGDSFKRIHWPTSVRSGELMVKTFEQDPSTEVWVVLDLEAQAQAGQGDDGTEEWGVKAAAAVAYHLLAARRPLGLLFHGQFPLTLEPGSGEHHLLRILEALALARAQGEVPLAQLLLAHGGRFGANTALVVITPSGDTGWVDVLRGLGGQSVSAAVIFLDPATFDGLPGSLASSSALSASNIYTYRVRRGDDLRQALRGPDGRGGRGR